jgi:hypothetical protein
VSLDLLVLNSGEWLLGDELAAEPWYVLIYRQRGEPRNELHLWLPRQDAPRSEHYACRRYWVHASVRWCLELSRVSRSSAHGGESPPRLRFSSADGQVLWADPAGARGLGDLSDRDLAGLLGGATSGTYSGV